MHSSSHYSGLSFLGQQFHPGDLGTIGVLVVLEALLSADNALVLAILVRHLPQKKQKQALLYGLGGAFVLRTLAILLAASIIQFWWLQLIGSLYLLYLPVKHFIDNARGKKTAGKEGLGFWATVVYLNVVDLAFALDSVVAAVAVVDTVHHPDKLWVVVAGAMIGIVLLRFAASYFIRLLERYPILDHVAYVLVGWAGLKLFLISGHSFEEWYVKAKPGAIFTFFMPEMNAWVFWGGMTVIAVGGLIMAVRNPAEVPAHEREARRIDRLMRTQIRTHHPQEEGTVSDSQEPDPQDGKEA